MKILQKCSTATETPKKQIATILNGQNNNFRKILKSDDLELIGELRKELTLTILYIANTYTGANFSNPPSKDDWISLRACTNLVLEMFPALSLPELELSFKMASAGKFPELNLETYYGKFTVNFLGKILREYIRSRNKVLMKHNELQTKENQKMTQEQIDAENERTKQSVISKFQELKKMYKNGEKVSFEKLYSYWAKILIESGDINFTDGEKKIIWLDAQKIAKEKLKKMVHSNENTQIQKIELRSLIRKIESGEKTEDFKQMSILEYSKLLVIKSIKNE